MDIRLGGDFQHKRQPQASPIQTKGRVSFFFLLLFPGLSGGNAGVEVQLTPAGINSCKLEANVGMCQCR